jgi:hypothetical protein
LIYNLPTEFADHSMSLGPSGQWEQLHERGITEHLSSGDDSFDVVIMCGLMSLLAGCRRTDELSFLYVIIKQQKIS